MFYKLHRVILIQCEILTCENAILVGICGGKKYVCMKYETVIASPSSLNPVKWKIGAC